MKYLHPPGDEERFGGAGSYEITRDTTTITETWERHRRSDGFSVWRIEQAGERFLRLGHLLIGETGRPERLQIHQRGDAGLQRQTYTFFDESVMVVDNRVAGRRMVECPAGCRLLAPFAAGGAFAFPFAPTREEPADQTVYVVEGTDDGLLEGRLADMAFEPLGVEEYSVAGTQYVGHKWRLRRQDQPEDVVWITDTGLTLRWLRDGQVAELRQVRIH